MKCARLRLLLACSCFHVSCAILMVWLAERHVDPYTEQNEEERSSCRDKIPYSRVDKPVTMAVIPKGHDRNHHGRN